MKLLDLVKRTFRILICRFALFVVRKLGGINDTKAVAWSEKAKHSVG